MATIVGVDAAAVENLPRSVCSAHGDEEKEENSGYQKGSFYSSWEKWFIVVVTSIVGVFSSLAANVYFPAIPAMAQAFQKPVEAINLSVTAYVILQGVSPMLWGTVADYKGRRPSMIACLLILSLTCVGIALVPTNMFWLLVLLRCLQAAGSASTFSVGAGIIADITSPHERGGMMGLMTVGLAGPAIGPVLSGLIADKYSWRGIFWGLAIASAVGLLFISLFLPETLPSIVGDGSITPPILYRPVIPVIGRRRHNNLLPDSQARQTLLPPKASAQNPFRLLVLPDVFLLLCFNGVLMAAFYGISATLTPLYHTHYPFLSTAEIGYCFLAFGGSMAIGTLSSGRLLDFEYSRYRVEFGGAGMLPEGQSFPIEKARLGLSPAFLGLFIACCAAYGWCVMKVSLAVPLVLLVAFGFTFMWLLIATQTLLVDLVPLQGSSVTACNNLARCATGAIFVSIIQLIVNAMGAGWTFVFLAGILGLGAVILWAVVKIGPACREKRMKREGNSAGIGTSF